MNVAARPCCVPDPVPLTDPLAASAVSHTCAVARRALSLPAVRLGVFWAHALLPWP